MSVNIKLVLAVITNVILWIMYGVFSTRFEWEGYNILLFIPLIFAGCWLLWQIVPEDERPKG